MALKTYWCKTVSDVYLGDMDHHSVCLGIVALQAQTYRMINLPQGLGCFDSIYRRNRQHSNLGFYLASNTL